MKKVFPSLLVFISGHGYGHASRMRHLLKSLKEKAPSLKIIAVGTFPSRFVTFKDSNNPGLHIHLRHDVGVVQSDFITMDLDQTFNEIQLLEKHKPEIINEFLTRIADHSPFSVISDSSSFAFRIAQKLHIPGFFIGNFTWLDIYRGFAGLDKRFSALLPRLEEEYLMAEECWQLPLHTDMAPFQPEQTLSMPLLAPSPSSMTEKEWANWTGLSYPQKRKVILLSYGGYDFDRLPMEAISGLQKEFIFLTTTKLRNKRHPENLIPLTVSTLPYQGLIKYCDAVMTKPGYGILSDCLVERKPIIYTERGLFAEYEILKNWLESSYPSVFLSGKDFISGSWMEALKKGLSLLPLFPSMELNGGEVMAKKILKHACLQNEPAS